MPIPMYETRVRGCVERVERVGVTARVWVRLLCFAMLAL